MSSFFAKIRRRRGWLELNNDRLENYIQMLQIGVELARKMYFKGEQHFDVHELYKSAYRSHRNRSFNRNRPFPAFSEEDYKLFRRDLIRIFNYWGMIDMCSDYSIIYFQPYYPNSIQLNIY